MDCSLLTSADVADEVDLLDGLSFLARVAGSLVSSCVGASLTVVVGDTPTTVTATSLQVAVLDATQYLGGGPCVDAARGRQEIAVPQVPDAGRWPLYAQAAGASGVRSSLSLPVAGTGGHSPGAVNLYARDAGAFDGMEDLLAEVFAVPVEDLVSSAAPARAHLGAARTAVPDAAVGRAVAVLAAVRGWRAGEAAERLRAAAGEARVPVEDVAGVLLGSHAA
jgi:hypothetical protein